MILISTLYCTMHCAYKTVIDKFTVRRMIETYCPAVHDELVKIGVNSKGGRGGMTAKMQAAWMAAQQGVTTVIANGKASDSLLQVRHSVQANYLSLHGSSWIILAGAMDHD